MVKVKCKRCNKVFEVSESRIKNGRGKYCSKKCQNGERIKKICLVCNKNFKISKNRKNTAKYCSRQCYNNSVVKIKRTCQRCGKKIVIFNCRKDRTKFCSKKCIKVLKIEKQCIVCNKKFEVYKRRKDTAKFCSYKCHHKYNKGKNNPMYGKHQSKKAKKKISIANKGKKRSEEQRKKMSKILKGRRMNPCSTSTKLKIGLANKGKNNGQWKGGITSLRVKIWRHFKSKEWRLKIYERDSFICQMPECNKIERILNAHHIKPFSRILENNKIKTLEDAENCKELWDINNGITLCEKCHKKTYHKEKKYESLFKEIIALK